MTAPRCVNPRCGQPRRKRPNQPGYAGGRDLCQPCYQLAWAAGFPDEIPAPTPPSERNASARARATAEREERMAEFARMRARGYAVSVSAMRVGVGPKCGEKYETEMRRRARQEVWAAA